MTDDGFGWPDWWLIFGGKKNADEPGCCLSLHRDMIHALVTLGFPSFRWLWQESVYCKRFFTERGGRPSLSRFVFPSQLASLRGKSNSVGSEVGHYEQTSRLPNVWWRDKKRPRWPTFRSSCGCDIKSKPLKKVPKAMSSMLHGSKLLKTKRANVLRGKVFNQGGSGAGLEAVPTLEPVLCISTVQSGTKTFLVWNKNHLRQSYCAQKPLMTTIFKTQSLSVLHSELPPGE